MSNFYHAVVSTIQNLPTVIRYMIWLILAISIGTLLELAVRTFALLFRRTTSKHRGFYECGHPGCINQFPGYLLDTKEPKPHKLQGWTYEDGDWYCRIHNAGRQIPLPFKMDSLKPKSKEAERLRDYLGRRRDTF